jgi:hypothetical protein
MLRIAFGLNSRSNVYRPVFATLFFSAAAFFSQPLGHAGLAETAEIRGRVTECWEGKHRPVADLRVYVLSMEESEKIRRVLEKMKQLPHGDSQESARQYVQSFSKLYDELIAETKAVGESKGLTRTSKDGQYASKNLRLGRKYLVLAIDWDRDDSDDIGYYSYSLTHGLQPGPTTLNIFMGPGKDSDCR